MRHQLKFIFVFIVFCVSCSKESVSNSPVNEPVTNNEVLKLRVNGSEVIIPNKDFPNNSVMLWKSGPYFTLQATYGQKFIGTIPQYGQPSHFLALVFDTKGNIVKGSYSVYDPEYGPVNYAIYKNFPSNYFKVNVISLDETSKKIKATFTGPMFLNSSEDLTRESITIDGDLNFTYPEYDAGETVISYYLPGQNCTAKINGEVWTANHEYSFGSFTASDPYKIDIAFAENSTVNSYPFSTSTTINCIKFYKFNTTTLTYDSYNVNGVVAYSYREFHGGRQYSYFGSFSFTAVNPNNPLDIIQVTDGAFRSIQTYY